MASMDDKAIARSLLELLDVAGDLRDHRVYRFTAADLAPALERNPRSVVRTLRAGIDRGMVWSTNNPGWDGPNPAFYGLTRCGDTVVNMIRIVRDGK